MSRLAFARPYADADIDDATGGEPTRMPGPRPVSTRGGTRVLLASSEPIVRHGLHALLTAEGEFDVVAEAEDGATAVTLARRLRPDLVVIELLMPQVDGLTATRMIRSEAADTHVVVMAGVDDETLALESIRAGACAYLSKATRTDAVLRTIRGACAGQVTLPSGALARLVRADRGSDALSERESAVLRLVGRGRANKQIARELGIAQSTVKSHVGSLLDKLGLGSRTQLALYAARTGLVALNQREAIGVWPALSGA
jgi:NarL family two-component system response regulator LiaR